MKKFLITILTLVSLLALLAIPAFGSTSTTTKAVDWSQNYVYHFFNNALTGRYNIGNGTLDVRASTDLSLSYDEFGESKVTLTALNKEVVVSETDEIYGSECNGLLNSGKATVPGQSYGYHIIHYGWRATNSYNVEQFKVTIT